MERRLIDANRLSHEVHEKIGYIGDSEAIRKLQKLIHAAPSEDQWINLCDEQPPQGTTCVLFFSIKGSKIYGDKNSFIECGYTDGEAWYYTDGAPIVTEGEEIVVKFWLPLPTISNER